MKQFNRLPRWLRVIIPAFVIAVCIAINAVAFTEIVKSFQSRDVSAAASRTAVVSEDASPPQLTEKSTETPTSPVKITPAISPDATLESAVAQARAAKRKVTAGKKTSASEDVATAAEENAAVTDTSEPLSSDEPSDSLTTAVTITPVGGSSAATENTDKSSPAAKKDPKYGHLPYAVGDLAEMSLIASYAEGDTQRLETLHPDAATALMEMVAAARADGIWLVPASGFRTVAQQRTLFNAQIATKGSPEAAAWLSAPPGYSEHHTGYAVDLTDGTLSQSEDISITFAQSPAYAWLTENAAAFQFELSFPENNEQGISYEPWHWRYVGSPEAKAIFKSETSPGSGSGSASEATQSIDLSAGLEADLNAALGTGQAEAVRESVE